MSLSTVFACCLMAIMKVQVRDFYSNDIEISREMSHDTISNNRYVGTQLLNVS